MIQQVQIAFFMFSSAVKVPCIPPFSVSYFTVFMTYLSNSSRFRSSAPSILLEANTGASMPCSFSSSTNLPITHCARKHPVRVLTGPILVASSIGVVASHTEHDCPESHPLAQTDAARFHDGKRWFCYAIRR